MAANRCRVFFVSPFALPLCMSPLPSNPDHYPPPSGGTEVPSHAFVCHGVLVLSRHFVDIRKTTWTVTRW